VIICETQWCATEAVFTLRLQWNQRSREREWFCERCAMRADDSNAIVTGSEIRLFPQEAQR